MAFFACSVRFGKNGDFLAAQPPQRSFDRPVRWYLRYLRARDVQSATLAIVYVTSGGSSLPVRPKKRPRVPKLHTQNGRFPAPGARLLGLGCPTRTWGWAPIEADLECTKAPSHRALRPKKQQICQKNKKKSPGGIEPTTTKTATTDNPGQWNDGLSRSTKGVSYFPHLLVLFVVAWHVFSYQVLPQCATTVPWAAAWAPSVSECQHAQPA